MDAERFLFVSADAALIVDLAWQIRREGHEVKYYDENSRNAAVVFRTESGEGSRAGDARVTASGVAPEGVRIEDAKRVDGQWRVAGESGMPLVVTGMGETMQEARERCYARVDDVLIPNCYYRDDIGERWIRGDGDRLQAWGYLGPRT